MRNENFSLRRIPIPNSHGKYVKFSPKETTLIREMVSNWQGVTDFTDYVNETGNDNKLQVQTHNLRNKLLAGGTVCHIASFRNRLGNFSLSDRTNGISQRCRIIFGTEYLLGTYFSPWEGNEDFFQLNPDLDEATRFLTDLRINEYRGKSYIARTRIEGADERYGSGQAAWLIYKNLANEYPKGRTSRELKFIFGESGDKAKVYLSRGLQTLRHCLSEMEGNTRFDIVSERDISIERHFVHRIVKKIN